MSGSVRGKPFQADGTPSLFFPRDPETPPPFLSNEDCYRDRKPFGKGRLHPADREPRWRRQQSSLVFHLRQAGPPPPTTGRIIRE